MGALTADSCSDGTTIAAVATPPGRGGVGIVRISGPAAADIARSMLGHCPPPRQAAYLPFFDRRGESIDRGIALYFPAPHSFTGEDVLELQGHGGPIVMDLLLQEALHFGARAAVPGEFSQRAFFNDKLDLVQAEAIADLIDSTSEQAARNALRSLQGEFSARVNGLAEGMINLRMHVEAALDFPEEDIDFLADGAIAGKLETLTRDLDDTLRSARQGNLLREGMQVVIAGLPNAGKSSLLNALAGREAAIVTDIPGTTRDVLREQILIDGMPVHITDTAGLRTTEDIIEQEGMRRAWQEIEQADRILLVVDDRHGVQAEDRAILDRLPERLPVTFVYNKIDLSGRGAACHERDDGTHLFLSVQTGDGLDGLRAHLARSMGLQDAGEGLFSARRRHLHALEQAAGCLELAAGQLAHGAGELMAEELHRAHQALGEITGAVSADDLLGHIFAGFCIGK